MEECLECAECAENKRTLAAGYASCRAAISELGGELRGRIVTALLQGPEYGLRLSELIARTYASRPVVLRHLAALRKAKFLSSHKRGREVYYYLDANVALWKQLAEFFGDVYETVRLAAEEGYPLPFGTKEE